MEGPSEPYVPLKNLQSVEAFSNKTLIEDTSKTKVKSCNQGKEKVRDS